MAQKLTAKTAEEEARRLLEIALLLLDDAANYRVGAYVAYAIDILSKSDFPALNKEGKMIGDEADFRPLWGTLVDRENV